MHIDPSGYVMLVVIITSIVISVLFEMYDDYSNDGELNPIYNWKGYLGAVATGYLSAIGGSFVGVVSSVLAGAFSGDVTMDNFGEQIVITGLSVGLAYGLGKVTKFATTKVQTYIFGQKMSRKAMNDFLRKVGMNKISKTIHKSSELLYKELYKNPNLITNTLEGVVSSTASNGLSYAFD